MKQVSVLGPSAALTTTAARFQGAFSSPNGGAWDTSEPDVACVIPTAGTIRNLYIKLSAAPGAAASGKKYRFEVVLNGTPQAILVDVLETATTGSDTTHSISVAAGDTLSIKCTPTSTPTAVNAFMSLEFEGTTASYNILASAEDTALSASATQWIPVHCGDTPQTTAVNDIIVSTLIPHACTIRSFYMKLQTAPGGATARKFTIMKNGVAETSSAITITGAATTGNATGLSISLAAGDRIYIQSEIASGTPATSKSSWGVAFESNTDGQSILAGSSDDTWVSSTEYHRFSSFNESFNTTETNRQAASGVTGWTAKNMRGFSGTLGGGISVAVNFRKGAASGNQTFTIGAGGTTGNDGTHSDTISQGDLIDMQAVKTGGSPAVNFAWCMTQEIAGSTSVTANAAVQSAAFSIPAPSVKLDFQIAATVLGLVANLIAPTVIPETKISPSVQSVAFSIQSPSVVTDQVLSPAVQQATFAVQAPSVSLDFTVSPTVQTATFSIQNPTVTIEQDVTASAGVQSATFSLQAPAVSLGATASPSAQVVTASVQAPALSFDYQVTASALSATFSIQAPVVGAGVTTSVAAQSATFSTQAFSIVTDQVISPAALSATFSIPAPSVAIGISLSPSVQTATFSLQSPTVTTETGVIAQTSIQSAVFSLIQPITKYDFSVFPAVQIFTFSIQVPTRTGSFYEDKYSPQSSSFSDKYSNRGSSFSDKYSSRGSSYSDKFSPRSSSYDDKYSSQGTDYDDKYTPKNL